MEELMTLNDLFNQHINLTLFILEDLKATDNQKNLFRNLTRQLQRNLMAFIETANVLDKATIERFIADSRSKSNEQPK